MKAAMGRGGGKNARGSSVSRGLPIREVPLAKILAGSKTWEIRSRPTAIRGRVALIRSGSKTVVGICRIVDCIGPFTPEQRRKGWRKAGFPKGKQLPARCYAWVMEGARRLRAPVPYRHPRGAITWVRLAPRVVSRLPSR